MNKYIIRLFGKGSETYLFPLNKEQLQKLKDLDVEESDVSFDEIYSILGVKNLSDTDISYMGPYYENDTYDIVVENDKGDKIWEKETDYYFEDPQFDFKYDNDDVLLIEDYSKGEFFNFEIEIEGEFDFNKLNLKILEIGERIEIVHGLIYDGIDLDDNKVFADIWSKGIYFHICEKFEN